MGALVRTIFLKGPGKTLQPATNARPSPHRFTRRLTAHPRRRVARAAQQGQATAPRLPRCLTYQAKRLGGEWEMRSVFGFVPCFLFCFGVSPPCLWCSFFPKATGRALGDGYLGGSHEKYYGMWSELSRVYTLCYNIYIYIICKVIETSNLECKRINKLSPGFRKGPNVRQPSDMAPKSRLSV